MLLADNWFALIVHPPTLPPSNNTFEPDITPEEDICKLALVKSLIVVSSTLKPPIDAETNLA